jgi:hypothetical protein
VEEAFCAICREVKQIFQRDNVIKPVIKISTGQEKQEQPSNCRC